MDIEKLIKETFTAHEHVVPDGDPVLAAARQHIDRRRTVLSRPLAVAAGVVVLTLAAVTLVALNRPGPAPAPAGNVAAPPAKVAAKPAVADLSMPYSLGWLPPGPVSYLARRINIGGMSEDSPPLYGGEYLMTITVGGKALDVDVQQMRMMPVDDAAFKSGPGKSVTINGQRGVESAHSGGPGGYELYVAQPDGGSMYVNVAGGGASAQQLVAYGRRVAQNIHFPGTTTVTPAYGLRDLPGGMRICAFDVAESGRADLGTSGTSYALGDCKTMPPINVYTPIGDQPPGTPGKPVQGHKTRVLDEDGYRTLWVLNAVDGDPVNVAGRVPLNNLYDIADHLVLPH
jgi:hypothetical protein